MISHENLPEGYTKKRKKATLRFIVSIYLYIIISLIMTYIKFNNYDLIRIIYYSSIGLSVIFLFLNQTAKITYNNIPIPIYNEIHVFSKKEVIAYIIPMLIAAPFIISNLISYLSILAVSYLAIKTVVRPPDVFDYNKSRRY